VREPLQYTVIFIRSTLARFYLCWADSLFSSWRRPVQFKCPVKFAPSIVINPPQSLHSFILVSTYLVTISRLQSRISSCHRTKMSQFKSREGCCKNELDQNSFGKLCNCQSMIALCRGHHRNVSDQQCRAVISSSFNAETCLPSSAYKHYPGSRTTYCRISDDSSSLFADHTSAGDGSNHSEILLADSPGKAPSPPWESHTMEENLFCGNKYNPNNVSLSSSFSSRHAQESPPCGEAPSMLCWIDVEKSSKGKFSTTGILSSDTNCRKL